MTLLALKYQLLTLAGGEGEGVVQIYVFWRKKERVSYVFLENVFEIPQLFREIWTISPSVLTIFNDFSENLTIPCCKRTETNNASIKQTMSAFFSFNLL